MIPLSVADAFATKPFSGNPAAICRLPAHSAASAVWMQRVAAEMNLSETAFVVPRSEGGWDLRWFTPAVEMDLCGHATLASAHELWETGEATPEQSICFHTRSGALTCRRGADGIAMDFPARRSLPVAAPQGLFAALGLAEAAIRWVGRNVDDLLVELEDEAAVRGLRPDFAALKAVPTRGVIVCARSADPEFDFVSRFFAPADGVDEDPVTGSAHCALAVYWAGQLRRNTLRGWQASARGGAVAVELLGDRVTLVGRAITVWRGIWLGGFAGASP